MAGEPGADLACLARLVPPARRTDRAPLAGAGDVTDEILERFRCGLDEDRLFMGVYRRLGQRALISSVGGCRRASPLACR